MTGSRQGRLFRGRQGLRELEAPWRTLQERIPDARFFHQYGWYLSYLESGEQEDDRVAFVLATEAGEPLAIFPVLRSVIRRFGLTLQAWEILWPGDMGLCDFVFAKTEGNRHLLAWLVQYLRSQPDCAWDVLRLQDTLWDSCVQYSLRASDLPRSVTFKHHVSKSIPCGADYETTMSRVSTDFRRNVRRQRKRVGELGQVEFRCVTEAADLPRALELFLEVEAASWKGASGTNSAILLHDKQIRFYRTLVDDFSKSRSCAINLVLLDDRCVAGQLALIVGDTLSLLKIAYRDEFKAMGAGNVLLDEVIRRACQSGRIAHISFITGAAWNDRWSPASADVYESYVYNSTATGIAAYALEKAKDHGRRFKHWALDLHGGPSAREGVAQAAPHGHGDADEARGR